MKRFLYIFILLPFSLMAQIDGSGLFHANSFNTWSDIIPATSHTDSSVTFTLGSSSIATVFQNTYKHHIIRWDSTTVKKHGFIERITAASNVVTCIIYGDSLKSGGVESNFQITLIEKVNVIIYDVAGAIPLTDTTATGGIIEKQIADEGDTIRILGYSAFLETNTGCTSLQWSLWTIPYGVGNSSPLGTSVNITQYPKVRTDFYNNRTGGGSSIKHKNCNIRTSCYTASRTLATTLAVIKGACGLDLRINTNAGVAPQDMHIRIYYCNECIFNL